MVRNIFSHRSLSIKTHSLKMTIRIIINTKERTKIIFILEIIIDIKMNKPTDKNKSRRTKATPRTEIINIIKLEIRRIHFLD
jgi:hypothetical protein